MLLKFSNELKDYLRQYVNKKMNVELARMLWSEVEHIPPSYGKN